ncbi:MAG: hypothetical protein ACXABY_10415 [Candidatus Thorarchaeota archaeon]|jgi:hypothetical protein
MCDLTKAEQIIQDDPNGKSLTDKNYQEVLTLLSCEINRLKTQLTSKPLPTKV